MITIIVLRPNMSNTTVKVENEDGHVKEFRFTDPARAQHFLEELCELISFIGLDYLVHDYR